MNKVKNKISLLIFIIMILQTVILNVNSIFAEQNGEVSVYENGEENLSESETETDTEETENTTENIENTTENNESVTEDTTIESNENMTEDNQINSDEDDVEDFNEVTEQITENYDNYYNKEENEIIIRFKDNSGKENFKKEYLKVDETNNVVRHQ